MKVGENNRLALEESDELIFRFVPSPNKEPGGFDPTHLIIHATEGQHVQSAINTFIESGGKSSHLILGRDGKEVVQMVNFNTRAVHAHAYNRRAIGIELDYTGHLREAASVQHHFSHISKFRPGEYIYGVALNDQVDFPGNLRPWPRYSMEQMDALVRIARLLVGHYGLQILGHEEINEGKLDPGPAFPMNKFKEMVRGEAQGSVVLEETGQDLELRTGPGLVYPPLPGGKLDARTPVSITSSHDGWALVEVMAEVGGNPWLVGWAKLDSILARRATPVVRDHKLFTSDGRQYKFIPPHENNYDAKRKLVEPKYLVIHSTDGIVMESTINAFRDANHGASAHLLIGRDGRVVQFVDFDTIAYHCGFSYWEEDFDLNRYSIGIELDNGANLSRADGVWKWKTTIIPDEDVSEVRHWKLNSKQGWQKFTPVQLEVAREIIQALKKKYGIRVILAHDVINLEERLDPGPLFPMEEFRQLMSGEPGVRIKVHQTLEDTPIFKNANHKPPNPDHPKHSKRLPARSLVKILNIKDVWAQIKVLEARGGFNRTEGWIRTSAVNSAQQNPKTTQDTEYYKLNPIAPAQAPPLFLRQSPLPPGTRLRIQKFEGEWALVSSLGPVMSQNYLEGWVERDRIALVGEESLVYPPTARRVR